MNGSKVNALLALDARTFNATFGGIKILDQRQFKSAKVFTSIAPLGVAPSLPLPQKGVKRRDQAATPQAVFIRPVHENCPNEWDHEDDFNFLPSSILHVCFFIS